MVWIYFGLGFLIGAIFTLYTLRFFAGKNIELVEKLLGREVGSIGARVAPETKKSSSSSASQTKALSNSHPPASSLSTRADASSSTEKLSGEPLKQAPSETIPRRSSSTTTEPSSGKTAANRVKVLKEEASSQSSGGLPTSDTSSQSPVARASRTPSDEAKRRKRDSVEFKNGPEQSASLSSLTSSNSPAMLPQNASKKEKSAKSENGKISKEKKSISELKPPLVEMKKSGSTGDLKRSTSSEISNDQFNVTPSSSSSSIEGGKKKRREREGPPLVVFDDKSTTSDNSNHSTFSREKPIKEGWMEIGTKVGGKKLVYNRRYFFLSGSWLAYYKNEQRREDQCLGYINLAGCEVSKVISKKEDSKPKFSIINKKHRIFHKHGPNPDNPPCAKKHYVFHRRSKKCRLRVAEAKSLDSWIEALSRAATEARSSSATPYDSEDDMFEEVNLPNTTSMISPEGEVVEVSLKSPLPASLREAKRDEGEELSDSELEEVESPLEEILEQTSEQGTPTPTEDNSPCLEGGIEEVPADMPTSDENREGLLKILTKAVGLDITTVSLPVSLNEPVSFLQRMCEGVQFCELLDKANQAQESIESLMYVSAFAISLYQAIIRTSKPFNPYLGETFEFVKENKYRFLAEQVSHHPPIGACHAESEHFEFWQEQGLKTKFGGNSLACEATGRLNVRLKKSGHYYCWEGIKSVVHNIIFGKLWVDHFGDTEIKNHVTGETARLEFKRCGWFNKGRYEVNAWILDSAGKTRIHLIGKWNESIKANIVDGSGLTIKGNLEKSPIWTNSSKQNSNNYWLLPYFCEELLELTPQMQQTLPPTDSRLRQDRIALEQRDNKRAAAEKHKLEERERAKRRAREQKGETWKPRYFTYRESNEFGFQDYQFTGAYWKEREQRVAKVNKAFPNENE